MSRLSRKDQQSVIDAIETDGLAYAFRSWSDFEDRKSEEFHVLRKAFVKAADELEAFVYKDYVPPEDEVEE